MSFVPTWSEAAGALFALRGPTAFSAGAGSGKTTALVELCVRLLSGQATGTPLDPGEVAAITFTEKAAAELLGRLRDAVGQRARGAAEAGGPEASAWKERLHGLDRMAVGTIHGFCGRLLREHAVEAGLDPEFAVLDEASSWPLRAAAARAAVVAALDARQPAAVSLGAGLGAGDLAALVTRLMGERSTRGLRGPQPVVEVAPAALEAARAALLQAAADVLAARSEALTEATRGVVARVGAALESLTDDERRGPLTWAVTERLIAVSGAIRRLPTGKKVVELRAACDQLRARAEALPGLVAEAQGQPQREALARLVLEAERRYAEACRGARGIDFDGLLTATRDLLADHPALRRELRGQLRALVVDEYQDVNGVQQEIFALLTAATDGEPPGPIPVAVGDPKQSIYGFRGADVSVFASLLATLPGEGGRVLHHAENHRSAPAIVALVNQVSRVALQPPAGAAPAPFELAFGEADALVARRVVGLAPATELLDDDAPGDSAARRAREAVALAARIQALVSGVAGVAAWERDGRHGEQPRRPRYGDIAILFRRTTALLTYERALRLAAVPVRLARGAFYQAPEVRDLGELLASLADPVDEPAWAALLRSPLCAVTDSTLLLLAGLGLKRLHAATPAELAGIPMADGERLRLHRFLDTWRALRPLRDRLPPEALLRRAAEALDLDVALAAGPDGPRRLANLEKAFGLAGTFGERGGTAAELGAWLRLQAGQPPREAEAPLGGGDAVTLTTIHQAKGLEWPIVILADVGAPERRESPRALLDLGGRLCASWFDPARADFIPTASLQAAQALARRAAEAESRRLLYVALTRARDFLVISGSGPPRKDGAAAVVGWRGLVELAVGGEPSLVRRVPVAEARTAARGPAMAAPAEGSADQLAVELSAPRLAAPPPPASVRLAVTELAEYARCPRRHHLTRVLGLVEPAGLHGGATDDDPARATSRGTLAHAMLAEVDLAATPAIRVAQLAAVAARRGYDPEGEGVRRIREEITRFLAAPPGLALVDAAGAGRLRREVPFLLRLDGAPGGSPPACYLHGAIDALVVAPAGGRLQLLDFKYALPRPGSAERYRPQLEAYALAASRAHGGAPVEARLQFLRGDFASLDVTPSPDGLASFARAAPALALGMATGGGDRSPAALGRDQPRCRAEGCGFVERCYRAGPAPDLP